MAAVVGAVLVCLWFACYVTATSQAEQMAASEKLKIEVASITAGTNTVALYVLNLGGDNVTLAAAYT